MNELKTSFLERQNKNALARKILQEFSAVLKSARFYPPDHPFFVESLRGLQDELEGAFAKENPLVFNLVEKELYFGPVALVENSLAQRQIAKELTSRKIFRLIFRAGTTADELQAFIQMLAIDAGKSGPEGSLRETLQRHPLPHIDVSFGQPAAAAEDGISTAPAPPGMLEKERRKKAEKLYGEGVQLFSQLISGIQSNQELTLSPIEALLVEYVGTAVEDENPLLSRTVSRKKGWDTSQHALHVSIFSLCLGKMLGFNPAQLATLGEAALLHDIGTALVPPEILEKQGDLAERERQIFERHPVDGAALLQRVPAVSGITLRVVLRASLAL